MSISVINLGSYFDSPTEISVFFTHGFLKSKQTRGSRESPCNNQERLVLSKCSNIDCLVCCVDFAGGLGRHENGVVQAWVYVAACGWNATTQS